MKRLKIICKIAGKVASYFGLMVGIVSLLKAHPLGVALGMIYLIVGCLIHELSEL